MRVIGNDTSIPRQTVKVASGTVTSGSPVIVNADGTVSSVTTSAVSQSNGSQVELINDGNSGSNGRRICYNPHYKVSLAVYRKESDNFIYGCRIIVINGTTISNGTEHVLYSGHQVREDTIDLIYDGYSKCWILGWTKSTSSHDYRYVRAIKYNEATADLFINTGIGNYNSDSSHMYRIASNNAGQIVSVYEKTANGHGFAQAIGINPDGSFSGAGTAVTFQGGNPTEGVALVYEPNCNRFVVFYNQFSSGAKRCKVFRVSGSTVTMADHESSEFHGSAGSTGLHNCQAVYDSIRKCIVFTFIAGNTAYSAVVEVIRKTSQSDDTWGSPVLDSFTSNAANTWANTLVGTHATCFDKSTGKVVVIYPFGGSGSGGGLNYQMMYKEGVVTNLDATSDQESIQMTWDDDGNTHSGVVYNYQNNVIPDLTYDEENKCIVMIYGGNFQQNATNHPVNVKAYIFASTQTNLTSGNYIGIAKNSASNGQNVTVSTQGSIATNLSGLTIGKEHYIQNNGTLSTTVADPSVIAGTALSATSLLVKG
tara:strand:- start:34 stop:1644 length:1611 start_codon:yes stop_codon:yes gene_type:complete